jgi:hypothetical protein
MLHGRLSRLRLGLAVLVVAVVSGLGVALTALAQDFPLYVADYGGNGVYHLDSAGNVTPDAFVPGILNEVVQDSAGNLYTCREHSPDITKIAPGGATSFYAAISSGCFGLLIGPSDELYVSAFQSGQIEMVAPGGGSVSVVATGLTGPMHLAFDGASTPDLLVAEFYAGEVSRVNIASGAVTTIATGVSNPVDVARGPDGNLYVSEVFVGEVSKVDGAGVVTLLTAGLNGPTGLAFHQDGRLFVANIYAGNVSIIDIGTGVATLFKSGLTQPVGLNFGYEPFTQNKADVLKAKGVPGKGIDKAPGLQKPFNPNSKAEQNVGKNQVGVLN